MSDKSALKELLPELDLIEDRGLRTKTLNVWAEALKEGGWKVKDLKKIPFTLLIETEFSLLDHTRAVTQTALAIAETLEDFYGDALPIDLDALISGALLHDVGKLLEYERKGKKIVKAELGKDLRHPFSGMALAYKRGIPSPICHMIAVHAKEGTGQRRSTEAFIINHSDFVNFEPLKHKALEG